jgi:hypothetical protein
MIDDERREARWIDMAVLAAGSAGCVLGGIGFFVLAKARGPIDISDVRGVFGCALGVAIPSGIIGMIGAAARTANRAGLVGAFLIGLPLFVCNYQEPTLDHLWQLAGFAALGSILCQVGAVASGTAACGEKQIKKIQFTVQQFLMFFIPVAIYFGYLRTLMRK